MNKKIWLVVLYVLIAFSQSCTVKENDETLKQEILDIEKAFSDMVKRDGLSTAFAFYAAEDAVLSREDSLFKGRDAIRSYFKAGGINEDDIILTWTPDFVDVSQSGDMAYTYGKYSFSIKNSGLEPQTGVFHTVWKRQQDGSWKYVWD